LLKYYFSKVDAEISALRYRLRI